MARSSRRPDHHVAVVRQLTAAGCTRLEPLAHGAYRWHSPKTNVVFLVEAEILQRIQANEILRQAGLPPMFPTG